MSEEAKCKLCGEPMPEGESMFYYHGFSGPCPKPPVDPQQELDRLRAELLVAVIQANSQLRDERDMAQKLLKVTKETACGLIKERDELAAEVAQLSGHVDDVAALEKERDELVAKCAILHEVCFNWPTHKPCDGIDASLPARARALLECVEALKIIKANENPESDAHRIAHKALAGLDG